MNITEHHCFDQIYIYVKIILTIFTYIPNKYKKYIHHNIICRLLKTKLS
jgi:hypothetical protein